jgi:hypothetical protein
VEALDSHDDDRDFSPRLRAANGWTRPKPGVPHVFLSFHGQDIVLAQSVQTGLEARGVRVSRYDPERLWHDGPMEMLRLIVTECHCILYVGPRSKRTRYVRFEHTTADLFQVPRMRYINDHRLCRQVDQMKRLASLAPRSLWPLNVSSKIQQSLRVLKASDFSRSAVVEAGRTGLDIGLDRVTAHHLDRIGSAMRDGYRFIRNVGVVLAVVIVATGAYVFFL